MKANSQQLARARKAKQVRRERRKIQVHSTERPGSLVWMTEEESKHPTWISAMEARHTYGRV